MTTGRDYRAGIERAADEVQIVCDRLDKSDFGEMLAMWLRKLPDDPAEIHPETLKRIGSR